MGFFEDLGKSVNKVSQDVSTRAKNMGTINKLNTEINQAKRTINQELINIGNAVVEKKDAKYKEFRDIIAEATTLIDDNAKKVMALKGIVVCQNCGEEVDIKVQFCGKCGAKVEKPEIPVEEAPLKGEACAECGDIVPEDSDFCPSCGAKTAKVVD